MTARKFGAGDIVRSRHLPYRIYLLHEDRYLLFHSTTGTARQQEG